MSHFKLDLKKFSHVASDEHTHTLKHYEGHELKIARKALSKAAREQMDAFAQAATERKEAKKAKADDKQKLAEGGEVAYRGGTEHHPAAEFNSGRRSQGSEIGPTGGHVQTYKTGDAGAPLAKTMADTVVKGESAKEDAAKAKQGDKPVDALAEGGAVQKFAEGGIPQALAPNDTQNSGVLANVNYALSPEHTDQIAAEENRRQLINKYNMQIAATNGSDPLTGAMGGGTEKMLDPNHPDQANAGDIDVNAMATAKAKFDQQKQDEAINAQKQAESQYNQVLQSNKAAALLGLPQQPVPDAPQGTERSAMVPEQVQPSQPYPTPGAEGLASQQSNGMPNDPMGGMMAGYQKQVAGLQGEANAIQGQAQRDQEIHAQKMQSDATAMNEFKAAYQGLEQERQHHIADIQAGQINPDKYWTGDKDGNGGHSKIAAGIGMILAGFNPTSAPNAAINMIRYQMDKNIEAQKANLNSKENLLAANLRQFGNLKDATEMTRIYQNDAVIHQLQSSAAKAAGPMAQANAQKAIGVLQQQNAQLQYQFGMRQAMMKLASGQATGGDASNTGPAEALVNMMMANGQEAQAKAWQERIVPGIGVSRSQPVPQDARTQMVMRKNFGDMLSKYQEFAKKNGGSFNPATVNQGKALAAELQGAYRQASNGGVFKEGEQKFIEKLIPEDPTQLLGAFRTNPKIQELMHTNNAALDTLKSSYGLPVAQSHASQAPNNSAQTALAWAQANPNDKRSAKILKMLGK